MLMEIKDLNFNTEPNTMCQNLLVLSRKLKLQDGPKGICIGTALDPQEFKESELKDLLKVVDKIILPKAQEMVQELDHMCIDTMSEIISLAFSDTISSIRESHNLPPCISLPNLLAGFSR
jgi:hypothetical protein